jgi:glucose dehydrogenase
VSDLVAALKRGLPIVRKQRPVRGALTMALTLMSASAAASKDPRQSYAAGDWAALGGDWGNTQYSALSQINVDTMKSLGGAWVRHSDGASSRATPVVADELMFVTAGPEIYTFDPNRETSPGTSSLKRDLSACPAA